VHFWQQAACALRPNSCDHVKNTTTDCIIQVCSTVHAKPCQAAAVRGICSCALPQHKFTNNSHLPLQCCATASECRLGLPAGPAVLIIIIIIPSMNECRLGVPAGPAVLA
jgi:hypothetical protein